MKLHGRHSNSSSSTPSSTAATGELKVAAMPAAAPATSRVLRPSAVKWRSWAIIEPMAAPVMMIGPSAPNGPPVPVADRGGDGLPQRYLRGDDAALGEDRLDRLAHAVTAYLLRA